MRNRERQIVVMGVMGAGKTTIGRELAARLRCSFYDADDLHPPENRLKMTAGLPLSEEDRRPWVGRVASLIRQLHERGETAVIACSALTERIRGVLAEASEAVVFVHLEADPQTIASRLRDRMGHFAAPSLLASQYAALERPTRALRTDASRSPQEIVTSILQELGA